MVERLRDEFDFRIITSDRDLGETEPYESVQINGFNDVGKASVYYASPDMTSFRNLSNLINQTSYDVLYLNSFFSHRFTIKPLILRRLGKLPDKPVIIAPRGEFSEGAMKLKWTKKRAYIAIAKAIGLYKDVIWQASSEYEERDINRWFGNLDFVHIAPDLTPQNSNKTNITLYKNRRSKNRNFLKIIFLSRISPMKNLDGALRILKRTKGRIELNIYGPITDKAYWGKCQKIIRKMHANITVSYRGSVSHEEVPRIISEHDLFFLPTHGENFGHVIQEALSVGTPALISDQTPWKHLESHKAGWCFPLENESAFLQTIEYCVSAIPDDFQSYNFGAYKHALNYAESNGATEANRELLLKAKKIKSV